MLLNGLLQRKRALNNLEVIEGYRAGIGAERFPTDWYASDDEDDEDDDDDEDQDDDAQPRRRGKSISGTSGTSGTTGTSGPSTPVTPGTPGIIAGPVRRYFFTSPIPSPSNSPPPTPVLSPIGSPHFSDEDALADAYEVDQCSVCLTLI